MHTKLSSELGETLGLVPHKMHHPSTTRPQLRNLAEITLTLELPKLLLVIEEELQPCPLLAIHLRFLQVVLHVRHVRPAK